MGWEDHMRLACPTLIYPCEFLNFSASRSTLDLAGRKAIQALEGRDDQFLDEYATAGSEKNRAMVDKIRQTLGLTSLGYQKLKDLVEAIGLPKDQLCTHCWVGVVTSNGRVDWPVHDRRRPTSSYHPRSQPVGPLSCRKSLH